MPTTYAQKQSLAQKKDAPTAASVLDSSSQSESLQRKADMANNAAQRAEAPRPNNTGMPDNLKAGIESLSGFSMDDVRVHYNSSKPATVQALAYTQGTDIHVAPGQEKHLPHEAWHVAQQMAGRVSPTTNINGMPVNDNAALEHEADVMGAKAETQIFNNTMANKTIWGNNPRMTNGTMQLLGDWKFTSLKLNKLGLLYSYYRWTSSRSGYQWYCYESGDMLWYIFNGKKSEELPREEWVKKHQEWAKTKSAKLGLEIELDRCKEGFEINVPQDQGGTNSADTTNSEKGPQNADHSQTNNSEDQGGTNSANKTKKKSPLAVLFAAAPDILTKRIAHLKKTPQKTDSSLVETSTNNSEDQGGTNSAGTTKKKSLWPVLFAAAPNNSPESSIVSVTSNPEAEAFKPPEDFSPLPPPLPRWMKCSQETDFLESNQKGSQETDLLESDQKGSQERVKEQYFKAKQIFSIADGLVDVTFDTNTNYDEEKTIADKLTIELVFNAKEIPLEDDMISIGENLIYAINGLTYELIYQQMNNKIEKLKKEMDSSDNETTKQELKHQIEAFKKIKILKSGKVVNPSVPVFGIHVTVPCPLQEIHNHSTKFDSYRAENQINGSNDCVKNFLTLIKLIDVGCFASKTDPKRNMPVMNRTSLGKIFSLMDPDSQREVLYLLRNGSFLPYNLSYGEDYYEVNKDKLFEHLINSFIGYAFPEDPTLVAAREEKFAISALGNRTEKLGENECPIFEFRTFSFEGEPLEEFPKFLQRIANEFRPKSTGV